MSRFGGKYRAETACGLSRLASVFTKFNAEGVVYAKPRVGTYSCLPWVKEGSTSTTPKELRTGGQTNRRNAFGVGICTALFAITTLNYSRLVAAEESKPLFTVLYTAESHAALLPCDCPLQPLGGVARRATLIKRYRERGPVLLIDGGGWAAGGLYDEDTDGDPKRDELRTRLMIDALAKMKYDAVGFSLSDDSFLQHAKLDASALPNLKRDLRRTSDLAGTKIILRFFPERETDEAAAAVAPTLRNLTQPKPDVFLLCVSRLGEQAVDAQDSFSARLILNAGRKTSQRTDWKVGPTQLVNFDYQARNLAVVEVFADGSTHAHLEALGKDIPDDAEIAALLAPNMEALKKKGKRSVEIEYWLMPECPGCKQARPELKALAADLTERIKIVPHWVVDKKDGSFSSLHGPRELDEARVQAVFAKYYPERIWDWFDWRDAHAGEPWQEGARALNILPVRIQQALAAGEAEVLLSADYELSERRQIHATPSLIISNRPYEGEIERLHLLGALCGALDLPRPDACKQAPACFFDAQCRKRGFVAKCIDAGKATARCDASTPAVKVLAVVLYDPNALSSGHERILEALVNDLPGIDYRLVDAFCAEGAKLVRRADIRRLPAFLLAPEAKLEHGFAEGIGRVAVPLVSNETDEWSNWLRLREDQSGVGSKQFAARSRIPGRADLFVSRFSKNGAEATESALDFVTGFEAVGLNLVIHDAVFWNKDKELAAILGIAELEEAARAVAVRQIAPAKLNMYLVERGLKRGSSYWDNALTACGIDAAKVRALAEKPDPSITKVLEADASLLKSLDASGEIILLAENCELVPILSRKDLKLILGRIAQRGRKR